MEAKHMAEKIRLGDRIEFLAHTPAFIAVYSCYNIRTSHPYRLINPWKSKLSKVSNVVLET